MTTSHGMTSFKDKPSFQRSVSAGLAVTMLAGTLRLLSSLHSSEAERKTLRRIKANTPNTFIDCHSVGGQTGVTGSVLQP